ncbi:phage antirepressor protein [Rickettsia monacensis]|nr:phage antirepressor protein [Rickettsia monacensis]
MEENNVAGKIGGKNAKTALENKTDKKVISTKKYFIFLRI